MLRDFKLSARSWLVVGLLLAVLAALLTPLPQVGDRLGVTAKAAAGIFGPVDVRLQAADRALPGGGTAVLSRCGSAGVARPGPRGKGERDSFPALLPAGHGYRSHGPRSSRRPRFHVGVRVSPGPSPMTLPASALRGGFAVDFHAPHSAGLLASARGLRATVVSGPDDKPVRVPPSGSFTFTADSDLVLRIELPQAAVCPGHDFADLMASEPERSNDAADYPVAVVTLTDPVVRAHRARLNPGTPPGEFSDRLVWVAYEKEAGEAA